MLKEKTDLNKIQTSGFPRGVFLWLWFRPSGVHGAHRTLPERQHGK